MIETVLTDRDGVACRSNLQETAVAPAQAAQGSSRWSLAGVLAASAAPASCEDKQRRAPLQADLAPSPAPLPPPLTPEEAARFLMQAQFSASPAEIASVRSKPYMTWLGEQLDAPKTLGGWDWLPFPEPDDKYSNAAGPLVGADSAASHPGSRLSGGVLASLLQLVIQQQATPSLPRLVRAFLLACGISLLAACGGGGNGNGNGAAGFFPGSGPDGGSAAPGPATLAAIQITPAAAATGAVGLTQAYTAIATDSSGATRDVTGEVTWTSIQPAVARIGAGGIATTLTVGATTITASLDGITSNSTTLTVSAASPVSIQITDSVSSGSTGPGLSGLAVVSDDFTHYASTADLLHNITVTAGGTAAVHAGLYDDGLNAKLAELDNSVRYNNHPTLKYSQPGGTDSTPQLHVYFPSTTHIWYRVKVRFSPGFTTKGTLTNSSNAYKLISWGWNSPINGSGRIEITNTTEYQLYENMQQGPTLIGGGAYLHAGQISTEWTDGGWYDYIVEVDHSRPTGVIRLWRSKDGQVPAYQGEKVETMNDGSMMPPLSNVAVGLNFNQVRVLGKDQALWWGEWEVVDDNQHANPFGLSH